MRAALADDSAGSSSSASIRKRTGRALRVRLVAAGDEQQRRRALGRDRQHLAVELVDGDDVAGRARGRSELMVMRSPTATGLVNGGAGVVHDVRQPELLAAGDDGRRLCWGSALPSMSAKRPLEAALDHRVAVAERHRGGAETDRREAQSRDREVSQPKGDVWP